MKRTHKELFILFLTCFIVFSSFSGAFFAVPDKVYAADNQWEDVSQDDLVTAFQYYCKSRNLTIDGSIADALTRFTTTTFNNICNTLGIDVNSLQADLKKTVEGNLGLRFLMNQQGVLAYNRIFAEFLQNNDIAVGDEVNNKNVYSGKSYNGKLLYVFPNNDGSTYNAITVSNSRITSFGSTYGLSFSQIVSATKGNPVIFTSSINGHDIELRGTLNDSYYGNYNGVSIVDGKSASRIVVGGYNSTHTAFYPGHGCLAYSTSRGQLFVGFALGNNESLFLNSTPISEANPSDVEDADVYITTNNKTINNNNYNNNYTIIYNDGDTYITDDDDEPLPSTPPSGGGGGGGGGGDDPTDPDVPIYDPYPGGGGPSTPGTTTTGSDGIFKLPDIGFDLPDIDWSLKNIGDKFPFCIPGDIVSVLTLLNASPEAPKLQATIPIPHVYEWDIDIDFSEYDRYAFIVRTVEFLGFVISLIYLTIRMVKG